jgi:hypothetical protein
MYGYTALPTYGKSNYHVPKNNEDILSIHSRILAVG